MPNNAPPNATKFKSKPPLETGTRPKFVKTAAITLLSIYAVVRLALPASHEAGKPSTTEAPPATTHLAPVTRSSIFEQPSSPTQAEMDSLNKRLDRHDRTALSSIPARGYKDGVAGVFRDHRLYVNTNSEIYFRNVAMPEKNVSAGYYFSLYVTRIRKSGKYDPLDGFHAQWFKGKGDTSFAPMNEWARHVSGHDAWLEPGGPVDQLNRN